MKHKEIYDALMFVAENPVSTAAPIEMPVWELVGRKLFEIANSPDSRVRGSMVRATKAQRILLDRMVGRRRPGTHPAQLRGDEIDFVDLTAGVLE